MSGPGGVDLDVLPANWDAVRTLCASATQWRVAPMGGLLGLDLAGARAAADGLGIKWPSAMPGLLIMEGVVLDAQSSEW